MANTRGYILTVGVLTALNVFLGVLLGITVHFKAQEKRDYPTKKDFCVPCDDVLGHPDDGLPKGIIAHENNTKCCAQDELHLPDLVKAYTTVWQDKRFHEENPTFVRCKENHGHSKALLKLHLSDDQTHGDKTALHWEKTLENDTHRSLDYAHGHVTIHHTGLYHVYSQVAFQYQENVTLHPEFPKQHIIGYRPVGSSEGHYRYIAKGSSTQCKFHSANGEQKHVTTSFIGTVYRLHKGDKVSVRVHNRTQLVPEKHMNFFGIHQV